jgi:hypothetical protein
VGTSTWRREKEGRGASIAVACSGPRTSGAGGGAIARTGESGVVRATQSCVTGMRGWGASGPGGSGRGT